MIKDQKPININYEKLIEETEKIDQLLKNSQKNLQNQYTNVQKKVDIISGQQKKQFEYENDYELKSNNLIKQSQQQRNIKNSKEITIMGKVLISNELMCKQSLENKQKKKDILDILSKKSIIKSYSQLKDQLLENFSTINVQKYNDQIPCDFNKAMIHLNANIFGVLQNEKIKIDQNSSEFFINNGEDIEIQNENAKNNETCLCCFKSPVIRKLSILSNPMELSQFGSGYPMFFIMIQYSIMILLVMFLTSGMYNLVSNIVGNACMTEAQIRDIFVEKLNISQFQNIIIENKICQYSFYTLISLANKKHNDLILKCNDILTALSIVVIYFLIIYLQGNMKNISIEIDQNHTTPADYSLVIHNIHKDKIKQLTEDLQKYGNPSQIDQQVIIKQICYNFDYSSQIKLIQQKEELIANYTLNINNFFSNLNKSDKKDDKITMQQLRSIEKEFLIKQSEINTMIYEDQKRYYDVKNNLDIFANKAIVSFNSELEKEAVLYFHNKRWTLSNKIQRWLDKVIFRKKDLNESELKMKKEEYEKRLNTRLQSNGHTLIIEQAAEPTNIIWENFKYEKNIKDISRVISIFITVVLLILSSYLIYYLKNKQKDIQNHKYINRFQISKEFEKVFETCSSSIISLIILMINTCFQMIMKNLSEFEKRLTRTQEESSYSQKLAFILFINSALVSFFQSTFVFNQDYFRQSGLIQNQTDFFIVSETIFILTNIFWAPYYTHLIKKWFFLKYPQKFIWKFNQKTANKYLEMPDFQISMKYAYLINTVLHTSFYAALIPAGIIVSILSLISIYWVYKYNILNRCTYNYELGDQLAFEMLVLLKLSIVFYSFSLFIFRYLLCDNYNFYTVIGLILGIVLFLLPSDKLCEFINPTNHNENEDLDFTTAYKNFQNDYYLGNPYTKIYGYEIKKQKQA